MDLAKYKIKYIPIDAQFNFKQTLLEKFAHTNIFFLLKIALKSLPIFSLNSERALGNVLNCRQPIKN
jgi:hypothetical protein